MSASQPSFFSATQTQATKQEQATKAKMVQSKKIIHVDMDAFFASVEQRDNSALRNKPVIVGGNPGERGVVSSASYEARACGVHSAMPSSVAQRLCPQAIFVHPHFARYQEVSQSVMKIFASYSDLVEPLSLDEAYIDVSQNLQHHQGSATYAALEILKQIKKETELTASAGISSGKFFAKIASDVKKPRGHFVLPPQNIQHFMDTLPIEKFYGIGKVTAGRLKTIGIIDGLGLRSLSQRQLELIFGNTASFYHNILLGIDNRPVYSEQTRQERKSMAAEKTFPKDISEPLILEEKLSELCQKVFSRLQKNQSWGGTLTVKIKLSDFRVMSKSQSGFFHVSSHFQFYTEVKKIFVPLYLLAPLPIRLIGVSVSNLSAYGSHGQQLLFDF